MQQTDSQDGLIVDRDRLITQARHFQRSLRADCAERPGRARMPDRDMLCVLRKFMPIAEITRVGELTELDDLGLPVFHACRPNSRNLSTSQGKALSAVSAEIGAIAESMEAHFASRSEDLISFWGEPAALARRGDGLRWMLGSANKDEFANTQVGWVRGVSLVHGDVVHLPFEKVGLDFRRNAGWNGDIARMSTIGLGAGQTIADAAMHALCEIIENDACTMIEAMGVHPPFAVTLSKPAGLCPDLDCILDLVAAASMEVRIVKVVQRQNIPVVGAFLRAPSHLSTQHMTFAGFACRLSAVAATVAAILEAAQSRLTHIAGARDDMLADDYVYRSGGDWLNERTQSFEVAFGEGQRAKGALASLIDHLVEDGAPDVILVPLASIGDCFHIVRVVVPGTQAIGPQQVVQVTGSMLRSLVGGGGRS